MQRKIEHQVTKTWVTMRADDAPRSNFKLHISLDINKYEGLYKKISILLEDAIHKGAISGFKYLHYKGSKNLPSHVKAKRHQAQKALLEAGDDRERITEINASLIQYVRLAHNPFTVYLPTRMNAAELTKLCQSLERVLQDVEPSDKKYLTLADLPLSRHLTFRQERLSEEYILPGAASIEELQQLKNEGQSSEYYQLLCANLYPLLSGYRSAIARYQTNGPQQVVNKMLALHDKILSRLANSPLNQDRAYQVLLRYLLDMLNKLNTHSLTLQGLHESYQFIANKVGKQLGADLKIAVTSLISSLDCAFKYQSNDRASLLSLNKSRFFLQKTTASVSEMPESPTKTLS